MAVPAAVIASAIGAGASSTLDPLMAGLSSWLGSYSNKKAQKRAYEYYKRSLQEGPALQRKGLEEAGYNPMLALGNIGSPFSANSNPSPVPIGNVVGSAAQGAKLGKDIAEGIKLENEKKRLENKNLLSDLDTKEVQRLQMEANESLIRSQADRSDLAYGRDIADSALAIASTAGSLYSAKAMRDLARSPKESITTIHHGDKNKPTEIIKSSGVPSQQSSASPKAKPNIGVKGHSAKSVGRVAGQIAKELLMLSPVVAPAALAIGEYMTPEGRKRQGNHYRRNWENNRSFSPLR